MLQDGEADDKSAVAGGEPGLARRLASLPVLTAFWVAFWPTCVWLIDAQYRWAHDGQPVPRYPVDGVAISLMIAGGVNAAAFIKLWPRVHATPALALLAVQALAGIASAVGVALSGTLGWPLAFIAVFVLPAGVPAALYALHRRRAGGVRAVSRPVV